MSERGPERNNNQDKSERFLTERRKNILGKIAKIGIPLAAVGGLISLDVLKPTVGVPLTYGAALIGSSLIPTDRLSFQESTKHSVTVEKPNISFDQVGGQSAAKKEMEGLVSAIDNPEMYREWGTKPPKGVMMYGPPGTGKTLLARAVASEADATFMYASVSKLMSKWYGQSEKKINDLFAAARKRKKAIIFIDEVDSFGNRDGAHEVTRRVLNTLLENMDGLNDEKNKNITVICATNKPELLDNAFKRAGRIDKWIKVPLPDKEGLEQIFSIHMKEAEQRAGQSRFDNIDLGQIAGLAERLGLSGADVSEIVRRTLEQKIRIQKETGEKPGPVTTEELQASLDSYEHVDRGKMAVARQ